jgi:hypothetical protein
MLAVLIASFGCSERDHGLDAVELARRYDVEGVGKRQLSAILLHDVPVLIIGNPNRDINSQGEIVEYQ